MAIFPQPIPNEKKASAARKRGVKSMGKVMAQKKRDDNRASAKQLVGQVSKFLQGKKTKNVIAINGAIETVRLLFHRIQLIKVQHLTVAAVSAAKKAVKKDKRRQ